MKMVIRIIVCAALAVIGVQITSAAINIPSDGSDGALVITHNTVIDLSQAVTGNWNDNNGANAGLGIYDSNKWAVVFKYSSITIDSGATVTFKNHPSRAPVVWLVQGDAEINGTVNLSGEDGKLSPWLAEPGPGGFRSGMRWYHDSVRGSAGFGPGGGATTVGPNNYGGAGSYGALGGYGTITYGNPSLIPLIGGSGGAGYSFAESISGGPGAGGGAILIAVGQDLTISGSIVAKGGNAERYSSGGSGGGIRLVADSLAGAGSVKTMGGTCNNGYNGGLGRIRIERVSYDGTLDITPDPSVVNLGDGATPLIWVPANGPSVRVLSIGGNPSPADPRAEFGAIGADVVLPLVTNTTVVLETTNVEQAALVKVRATPRANGNFTTATASVTEVVSEDPLVLRWTATVPVNTGYSAIQVQVVRP